MPPEVAPAAPVATQAPVQQNQPENSSIPDNNSQVSGSQNVTSAKGEPAPQTAAELFDVMMNGKSEKWSKEKVLAHASKSAMADKKFEEASQLRKENEKFRELAKKSPLQALLDPSLGLTKDQLRDAIEDYYNQEYIEPESLTEEQRELKRYREQEKRDQETKKEQKTREEAEALDKTSNMYRETFQKQIISALDASGLPKTAFHAARMAFHMQQNMKNGWEAPQEMIVEAVRNEHNGIIGQITSLPTEEAIKTLGNEFINKLRAYDLQKLRESRGKLSISFSGREEKPPANERPRVDMSDVNENFRRMKRGEW